MSWCTKCPNKTSRIGDSLCEECKQKELEEWKIIKEQKGRNKPKND